MRAKIIENATILLPNPDHKNFTETDNFIPVGKEIEGEYKFIKGKRRGEPFVFRLFQTNTGNLIYQNKLKPMTEINIGADSKQSISTTRPTKVKGILYNDAHIIGTILGSIVGYVLAKKSKKPQKQVILYSIGGGVTGYVAGKLIAGKPILDIKIKP